MGLSHTISTYCRTDVHYLVGPGWQLRIALANIYRASASGVPPECRRVCRSPRPMPSRKYSTPPECICVTNFTFATKRDAFTRQIFIDAIQISRTRRQGTRTGKYCNFVRRYGIAATLCDVANNKARRVRATHFIFAERCRSEWIACRYIDNWHYVMTYRDAIFILDRQIIGRWTVCRAVVWNPLKAVSYYVSKITQRLRIGDRYPANVDENEDEASGDWDWRFILFYIFFFFFVLLDALIWSVIVTRSHESLM